MIRTAIIIGSTRPGRLCPSVAHWLHQLAEQRGDALYDVVDVADFNLPHLDEPVPAAMGPNYTHDHTRTWSSTIASYDAYVIVTPEYNHSIPGALKDAIDYLYTEWHDKAIGFVGYGLAGGTRAVEHLRCIAGELQLADVRAQVGLSLFTDFTDRIQCTPTEHHEATATTMLDQVTWWATALQALRQNKIQTRDTVTA